MKKWIFFLSLSCAFLGCAKPEKASSLKPAYNDLNTDAMNSFNAMEQEVTQTSTTISHDQIQTLTEKLTLLRNLIPSVGFTKSASLDGTSVSFAASLDPAYQPVQITNVRVWLMCWEKSPLLSIYGHLDIKSLAPLQIPPARTPCYRYESDEDFDYSQHAAQLDLQPQGPFWAPLSGSITFQGDRAEAYRVIVDYQTFNDPTLKAWSAWQSAVSGVIADLLKIEAGPNTAPVADLLRAEQQKLQQAFDQLP